MKPKSSLLFTDLEKSVAFLADVLQQPQNDYMRAAAIQAFEICFELSWKYLQARLNEVGLEANSPRGAFRESGKAKLLDNVEQWLVFAEQRNLTVHTYQPQLADSVYSIVKNDFLPAAQKLLETAYPNKEI
jgi:nucleotidyltransferase substrate binding protein (TIGR01987 family)